MAAGSKEAGDGGDSAIASLELALCNPAFYDPLAAFCDEEHNQENLMLWRAVKDYLALTDETEQQKMAEEIVTRFIRSGAILEVNMAEGRRSEIADIVSEGSAAETREQLTDLKQTALQQLLVDSLPRFMRSERWKKMSGGETVSVSSRDGSGRRVTISSSGAFSEIEGLDDHRSGGGGEGAERRPSTMARIREIEALGLTAPAVAATEVGGSTDSAGPSSAPVLTAEDIALGEGATTEKRKLLGFSVRSGPTPAQKAALARLRVVAGTASFIVREGLMDKRGDHHKTWKRRHFVLAAPDGKAMGGGTDSLWDFGSDPIPMPDTKPPTINETLLLYLESSDPGSGDPGIVRGVIPASSISSLLPDLVLDPPRAFAWGIRVSSGRTFVFAALSNSERRRWLRALCAVTGATPGPSSSDPPTA